MESANGVRAGRAQAHMSTGICDGLGMRPAVQPQLGVPLAIADDLLARDATLEAEGRRAP
jgi:hypothetical protein